MVECFKTLMLCLNRIKCPKDIKSLIINKIIKKIVATDRFGYKSEWFELFGKKHGLFRAWYKNGQLKYETVYKNGLYREWYPTGQLKFEFMYIDGKENWLCREWYSNGKLYSEVMYKDGED